MEAIKVCAGLSDIMYVVGLERKSTLPFHATRFSSRGFEIGFSNEWDLKYRGLWPQAKV